ncbi:MAG: DUF2974 domain-containing protein [Acetatifactor sp.]|nr:DUF2974 domain-containing protein [Acetatifactor sp.]
METVIDYLKEYGQYSFREKPLNDVDSVILCMLSYLKFDGVVPNVRENRPSVTLAGIKEGPDYDKLFGDKRYELNNRRLVETILSGRRFNQLKMNCYMNLVHKDYETQFAALTFILDNGLAYVAFRGTDETLVGWKEDFNMAFLSPIPAQEYSVRYLNTVADMIRCPIYVGGHSKGGNLAIYSAMNCKPVFQERICGIYSLDGPGFRPELLENCHYELIQDRVVKIVPRESIIGMIFESDPNVKVVKCKGFGMSQHELFNWGVEKDQLRFAEEMNRGSDRTNQTLNRWVLSLNEFQIRTFVDTFYQVICSTQADNLIDLMADRKKTYNTVKNALKEVDPETSEVIKITFRMLLDLVSEQMKDKAKDFWHDIKTIVSK